MGKSYPIYSMVVSDEFILNTPDALMSGIATQKIINHCCPDLIEPENLSICDIQHILSNIRIASGGMSLDLLLTCPKCNTKDPYEIDLTSSITSLTIKSWNTPFNINSSLQIYITPASYKQYTEFSINNFRLKKQIYQIVHLEAIDGYEEKLSKLIEQQKKLILEYESQMIEKIIIDNSITVNEKKFIVEWVNQIDISMQLKISEYIESAIKQTFLPELHICCDECHHNYIVPLELDFSEQFRLKLISMSAQEIIDEISKMSAENDKLTDDILKMIWYMRGSISYSEAYNLTVYERKSISNIIKENIETSKKSGFPII